MSRPKRQQHANAEELLKQEVERLSRQLAECEREIAEQAKRIAELERQLAPACAEFNVDLETGVVRWPRRPPK